MDTATIAIIVLGLLTLGLAAAAWLLYRAKSEAEAVAKVQVEQMNAKLNEAAKSVGRVEALDQALAAAKSERDEKAASVLEMQDRLRQLEADLSAARTEARKTQEAAAETINQERKSAQDRISQEKEATLLALQREKSNAAELVAAAEQRTAEVLAAKDRELAAKDQQIQKLGEFIEKANETLGNQFKALSQDTLKDVSAQFEKAAKLVIERNNETTTQDVKLHQEQIAKMLQPMGLTLQNLDQLVKANNEKRGEAEAVLMAQIKEFAGANERLANALNKPVIRGSFAETKLEALLEGAGLVRGENFDLQVQFKDGDRLRIVDALVDMAQGKKLVIDSKNLLLPYIEYANAEPGQEAARLADYQKAVRTTLKSLSVKDYSKHWQGIDAVIMFLPDEGMYMAALESDRQLIATMYEHRVFTVSPVSLMPILKSVAYVLSLEKQNRDTQTIVDAGRTLYESLGVLLGKINTLGDRLEGGIKAYNDVIASFEGNVLPKSRTLKELGVARGQAHPDVATIDPSRREIKARTVRELAAPGTEPPALEMGEADATESPS